MNHWAWIDELARGGIDVNVGHVKGTWYVEIGGQLRATGKPTAEAAITEAIAAQAKVGSRAIAELARTRERLAKLNGALEAA